MKYLTKFETNAAYDAAKDGLIKPNVSYIVETNGVEYNPYIPPQPIVYYASAKLTETTDKYTSGLHTNAFNTTIKSHTFDNGVGTIEFDDDVTSIGQYAFYKCTSLTSIDIPDNVTSIGESAFAYCSGLTSIGGVGSGASVEIPNSVTSIGKSAFWGCSGLTSIEIPDSVTSIGRSAFAYCSGLTSIVIPDSVTIIVIDAFNSCSSLTSVTIGNGVTSIGEDAFGSCRNLTSIVSNAMKAPTIQWNTFRNVKTGGTLTVPSGSTGYNTWMSTAGYYLGYFNWTKVEQ